MRKPRGLKLRCYSACLVYCNEYVDMFPGARESDNICEMELNEILLTSMQNIWIRKACVQGFDCEYITFLKAVNMFERMEIK